MRNNKKVVTIVVTQNCYALSHASDALKNNEQVVTAAVSQDGGTLQHPIK